MPLPSGLPAAYHRSPYGTSHVRNEFFLIFFKKDAFELQSPQKPARLKSGDLLFGTDMNLI